jgi:hypothetical protein
MIHETNELMDFETHISFISPTSISSGNYIIKCFNTNHTPFYIQSPKCKSKQSFQKAGKKFFCDLVFTYEDESFLKWIEDFESFCQKKIFENRSTWFDSDLEIHDIENSFLPSLKIFKSGKQHILRANIPLRLGKCSLKIYNEQEEDVLPESIVENTNIMSILEIQGIKCSSRSFQIEYEVKQMMMLNPVDLFEKCVFSTKKHKSIENENLGILNEKKDLVEMILEDNTDLHLSATSSEGTQLSEESCTDFASLIQNDIKENPETENIKDLHLEEIVLENKDLDVIVKNENEDLKPDFCEINLEVPIDEEVLQLKNRNEVYFEMYREAKKKARLARDFALSAYLEVKRIKNTYLLDEAFDSDDEDIEDTKSLDNMKI